MHFWSSECFLLPPRVDFLLDVTFAQRDVDIIGLLHPSEENTSICTVTVSHVRTHTCIGSDLCHLLANDTRDVNVRCGHTLQQLIGGC